MNECFDNNITIQKFIQYLLIKISIKFFKKAVADFKPTAAFNFVKNELL